MRLLTRVTGEKSEAMYVWHRCWRVPFLKKEKIERKDFQDRTRKLNKNSVGPGIKKFMQLFPKNWGVVVCPPRNVREEVSFFENGDARGVSCIGVHVDEGFRICGGTSAQGHIACRVRPSRSQRGERWDPFRTVRYTG